MAGCELPFAPAILTHKTLADLPQDQEPPPLPPELSSSGYRSTDGPTNQSGLPPSRNPRVAAGATAILLGCLGVHKFILGYRTAGIIMLAVTLLTCGFGSIATGIISLIEGIIYLAKSDEEFDRIYVKGRRQWF